MTTTDEHAERFTHLRPLLFTIVDEILGSATGSDDVLQDSYLRWADVVVATVRDTKSYLAQLVTGQAINALRASARRREDYVGPWLPEPLVLDDRDASADVVLAESESTGLRRLRGGPASVAAGCKGRRMAPAISTTPHAGTVQASAGVVTDEAADVRQKEDIHVLAFRRAVEARELDRIGELLTEDVVFHSPIAFRPYRGRETVARIINVVATILEDFTFQREIGAESDDDHALVFGARIGDLSIQGCDFVHTDAEGLIDEFTVMLRPLRAVHAFEDQMKVRSAAAMAATPDNPKPAE